MKHLKLFENFKKINETGEWEWNIDLDYVNDNPDADDEFSLTIKHMRDNIQTIKDGLDNPDRFILKDIKGFDKYQGAYAMVLIDNVTYKIWQIDDRFFWIEDYEVDNTSARGNNPGFEGTIEEIISELNNN